MSVRGSRVPDRTRVPHTLAAARGRSPPSNTNTRTLTLTLTQALWLCLSYLSPSDTASPSCPNSDGPPARPTASPLIFRSVIGCV